MGHFCHALGSNLLFTGPNPFGLFLVLRGNSCAGGPSLIFVWSKFNFKQSLHSLFFFHWVGGAISPTSPNMGLSVLVLYIESS